MKVVAHKNSTGVRVTYPVDHDVELIASKLDGSCIMEVSDLPEDRVFRNSWELDGEKISVNLDKAREQCHIRRRQVREEKFSKWDVKMTIPSEATYAEKQRQKIRTKYSEIQKNIDAAENASDLGVIYTEL